MAERLPSFPLEVNFEWTKQMPNPPVPRHCDPDRFGYGGDPLRGWQPFQAEIMQVVYSCGHKGNVALGWRPGEGEEDRRDTAIAMAELLEQGPCWACKPSKAMEKWGKKDEDGNPIPYQIPPKRAGAPSGSTGGPGDIQRSSSPSGGNGGLSGELEEPTAAVYKVREAWRLAESDRRRAERGKLTRDDCAELGLPYEEREISRSKPPGGKARGAGSRGQRDKRR